MPEKAETNFFLKSVFETKINKSDKNLEELEFTDPHFFCCDQNFFVVAEIILVLMVTESKFSHVGEESLFSTARKKEERQGAA